MTSIKDTTRIVNWLISATLLFGLFTFSGYHGVNGSPANPVRIELIYCFNSRSKRVTSFKLPASKAIKRCLNISRVWINASLFLFSRAIKTRFKNNFKVLISFKKPEKSSNLKYTPRNIEELIPNSPKG